MTEYFNTTQEVDNYIQQSKGYDGAFLIQYLTQYLPTQSSVLELGSGEGKDITLLTNKGYQVTASDVSPVFLERLYKNFPNNTIVQLDAADIILASSFDAIYSNKVLFQITQEQLVSSIAQQYNLLHNKGIVCHSFWKGEGIENYDDFLVYLYTTQKLEDMFSDFTILLIKEYKEIEANDSILIIAQKNE